MHALPGWLERKRGAKFQKGPWFHVNVDPTSWGCSTDVRDPSGKVDSPRPTVSTISKPARKPSKREPVLTSEHRSHVIQSDTNESWQPSLWPWPQIMRLKQLDCKDRGSEEDWTLPLRLPTIRLPRISTRQCPPVAWCESYLEAQGHVLAIVWLAPETPKGYYSLVTPIASKSEPAYPKPHVKN